MRAALVALSIFAAGCATNDYKQFYTKVSDATQQWIAQNRSAPPSRPPEVVHVTESIDINATSPYVPQGYRLIGYSKFSIEHGASDQSAIEQAESVGADLVVIQSPKFEGTVTKKMAVQPNDPTLQSGSAQLATTGAGDAASVRGPQSFGATDATYEDVAINRFSYAAAYFVKVKYPAGVP